MADRPEPLPVLGALHSTPARRYLSTEPVPDEVIWVLLDAAIRGPTGGNRQGWGWVVVTDPAIKRPVAEWYLAGWDAAYGRRREQILAARAYGIGTTLTTLYSRHEDDVRDLLGLPGDALTMGLLPLGYCGIARKPAPG